jgi:GT2 family glycosyltransferase
LRASADSLRIAIGIATRGRPEILLEVLRELGLQSRPADRIIVSHVAETDIIGAIDLPRVEFVTGAAGLPRQRNAILDAVDDCDVVLMIDDDFLPERHYVATTLAIFAAATNVVVTTGLLLADGARGPGLGMAAARDILARAGGDVPRSDIEPTFSGYGCNMALRLDAIRAHALRFDERLPLYGWYEDIDFCRRLGRYGRVVQVAAARGVHLGVKGGRTSGRRLGYSQVVNPLYLWRKGTYPFGHALRSVGRHLLINGARSLWPEAWVDRRGRLIGNSLALVDILRGRARPERILDL